MPDAGPTEPADRRTGPVDPEASAPPSMTHLAVGLVAGAVDTTTWLLRGRPEPDVDAGGSGSTDARPGDVAAGLLFGARDVAGAAVGLAGQTVGAAGAIARGVARLPGVDVLARPLGTAAGSVASRGRRELAESAATRDRVVSGAVDRITTEVVPSATDQVAAGPLAEVLQRVLPVALEEIGRDPEALTGLVAKVLPGILDAALPAVLDRLESDPDALLELVAVVEARVVPDVIGRLAEEPETLMTVVDPVLPAVLDRLARDPEALLTLVDALLPQLLDRALPVALAQLSEDPDVVRELVRDQSGGIATDMANTVRARAVAADDIVDRLGRRLLRRPLRARPDVAGLAAPRAIGAAPTAAPDGASDRAADDEERS